MVCCCECTVTCMASASDAVPHLSRSRCHWNPSWWPNLPDCLSRLMEKYACGSSMCILSLWRLRAGDAICSTGVDPVLLARSGCHVLPVLVLGFDASMCLSHICLGESEVCVMMWNGNLTPGLLLFQRLRQLWWQALWVDCCCCERFLGVWPFLVKECISTSW